MPEPVAHGPELQAVEQFFNEGTFFERLKRRRAALSRLEGDHATEFDPDRVAALDSAGTDTKRDWLGHFGAHWLTPSQFPRADPKAKVWPVLREGFTSALRAAAENPKLDLEMLWVCNEGNREFAVVSGVADRVFAVILTPPTPDSGGSY